MSWMLSKAVLSEAGMEATRKRGFYEKYIKVPQDVILLGDWKIMFQTVGKVLKRADITSATQVFYGNGRKNGLLDLRT